MKERIIRFVLLIGLLPALFHGCAFSIGTQPSTPGPLPPPPPVASSTPVSPAGTASAAVLVGTLEIDGRNAFHNGSPAVPGAAVYSGDQISTGAATSLKLNLVRGGFVQLAEDSDPSLLATGSCLVVHMLDGEAWVDAEQVCIVTANSETDANSRVDIRGRPAGTGFTTQVVVVDGHVRLSKPEPRALSVMHQYTIAGGRVDERPLTASQVETITAWRGRYFHVVWCCAKGVVESETGMQCEQTRGSAFADEPSARKACGLTTWCCNKGDLTLGPVVQCQEVQGTVYKDEASARAGCVASGWCCATPAPTPIMLKTYRPSPIVSADTSVTCRAKGGKFYSDQAAARTACLPPPPPPSPSAAPPGPPPIQ